MLVEPSTLFCCVYQVFGHFESEYVKLNSLFDCHVVIGARYSPACLTLVTKTKYACAERAGYGMYRIPSRTLLFLCGYTHRTIRQFSEKLRRQRSHHDSCLGDLLFF